MIEARQQATLLIIPANKLDDGFTAGIPGLPLDGTQPAAQGTYRFKYIGGAFQKEDGFWLTLPAGSPVSLLLGCEGDSTEPGSTDEYPTRQQAEEAFRGIDYSFECGPVNGTPLLIWYGASAAAYPLRSISPGGLVYQFTGYTP